MEKLTFYYIAASRGRRNSGGDFVQMLEIGGDISHTITTVRKDNFIIEIAAEDERRADQRLRELKQCIKKA